MYHELCALCILVVSYFLPKMVSRACLVLASIIVGIGLFEISVRIFNVHYDINPFWKYHPVIGWSQVPNKSYHYWMDGKEIRVAFNSRGFHDVEHPLKKPSGTKRIVLVGDSFSEALQVNLDETFFRRLVEKLNQGGKSPWEAINLGVGDFGTTQEWVALDQIGLDYSPDVVICQIFPLNDICNNTLELCDLCKSLNDRYRPYFVLSDGELHLTSAQPFRNFLRRYFVSYGVVEHKILKGRSQTQEVYLERLYEQRAQEMGLAPLGPLLYIYVSDQDQPEVISKGWKITEKIVEKMARLCRERNIQFIPVVVPFEACVSLNGWKAFASDYPNGGIIQDYPEKRLGRLFDRLSVPGVLLKEPFERNRDAVLPYIGGHFNPEGHRVAAEAIYSKMAEIGLVH
jgi:hypothetical protein